MRLGNLNISEIEARAGVKFPQSLIDYMKPKHQNLAEGVKKGQWHCFDIPFDLLCGDMETATEINKQLSPLAKDFKQPLGISLIKQPAK
jgi:hypothetical protein